MTLIIEQAVRGLEREASGIRPSGRSDFPKAETFDLARWSRTLSFAILPTHFVIKKFAANLKSIIKFYHQYKKSL